MVLCMVMLASLSFAANITTGAPETTLSVNDPAVITVQPVAATKYVGQNYTFSVTANAANPPNDPGDLPLTYQWKKGGVDITGATGSSYTITGIDLNDAGDYTVVVTTARGCPVTSTAAKLIVYDALVFTKEPWNQTYYTGSTIVLFAEAIGEEPISYKWRKNGVDIPGAIGTQYVKAGCTIADAGDYTVVATDNYGNNAYTTAATIDVRPVGAPYPEWNFTHVSGAATATLVVNCHGVALQSQVVGSVPNPLNTSNVVKLGVVFQVGTIDHIIRLDAVLPADGDTATFTLNGASALDWYNNPSPINLGTFAGKIIGLYVLDISPVVEKRTLNTSVSFKKNGTVLSTNGQYYDW